MRFRQGQILAANSLRFLVIGCGSIGKRHIGNLIALDAGEIIAFDIRADRRQEVKSRFGIETLDNLDEGWGRAPNAVLITVPTSLHIPFALQAVDHGCHLFIEKPLSDSIDGVDKLIGAVRERNLVALVGCNMHFHPALIKVKELIENQAIGRVIAARAEFGQYLPDWHPWEDYRKGYSAQRGLGGGVILDAIHEIDYIRWILGEVQAVSCFAGKLSELEIETEDTAEILLRFTSGSIGEIHMDYVQRIYSRACQIIGDEGTIRWDYTTGTVSCYSAGVGKWRTFSDPEGWTPNQMYLDEVRHFINCLSGEEQPTQDLVEASRTLCVALAARTSAETQKVVRLGE